MATRERIGEHIDRWCQRTGKTRDDFADEVGMPRYNVEALAREIMPAGSSRVPGPGEMGAVVIPVGGLRVLAQKYGADDKRLKEAIYGNEDAASQQ
jgi:hypothetical protein